MGTDIFVSKRLLTLSRSQLFWLINDGSSLMHYSQDFNKLKEAS